MIETKKKIIDKNKDKGNEIKKKSRRKQKKNTEKITQSSSAINHSTYFLRNPGASSIFWLMSGELSFIYWFYARKNNSNI